MAKTRRYQMGISKFLHEIENIFHVYGYKDDQFELFRKNINYIGFLIVRKEIVRKEYIILEEQSETYMTSSSKNKEDKKRVYNDRTVDGPELVNVNTSPFVLKKMEMARKRFEKTPITEEFLKKHGLL